MLRLSLTPLLACGTLLLTGAVDRHSSFDSPDARFVPQGLKSSASDLLHRALDGLSWSKVRWLDMTIWQKIHRRLGYSEITGRYRIGPDMQMCLNLQVVHGKTKGKIQAACNGRKVWCREEIAAKRKIETFAIPDDGPRRFLERHGCGGPRPLLQAMLDGLQHPTRQLGVWEKRKVWRVSGKWKDQESPLVGSGLHLTDGAIYIDAQTLLPIRVEWHGTHQIDGRHQLLFEVEFRHLVVNDAAIEAFLREDLDHFFASMNS